ncbi:hypothetical protein PtA15_4A120 [Puccinia triticina]|nr:uncharacterized protein PtA15_4A120 [Puccinia triticina]WAQ83672.1 hypothetical protein PtA15_4A120 [Puccinia triticina]
MILQLWLEGRSLVIHRQGVDLLVEILETRNRPLPIPEPSRHEVTPASQPNRRSLQYQSSVLESNNTLLYISRKLTRRDEEKDGKPPQSPPPTPTVPLVPPPSAPSPRPSPGLQLPPAAAAPPPATAPLPPQAAGPPPTAAASPPTPVAPPAPKPASSPKPAPASPPPKSNPPPTPPNPPPPVAQPNPPPPQPPPAQTGGRDGKKVKAEEEVNKQRKEKKPTSKSSQTRLEDVERDPSALSILQEVNLKNGGDPTTMQTTDVAAPGAAIFVLDGNLINLSAKCVTALKQPMKFISRSHRTDIARIVFHIWLWGLTIWGLLLESVPHIAAVVVSQFISTAFVALDLRKTITMKEEFSIVVNSDCDGVDVLPEFWGVLLKLDVVAVVFAATTALAFTFLAFKLYAVLDWRTFKKLGASRMVRIAHTLSLIFAAILQLNAYFVIVFLALWLEEVVTYKWKNGSKNRFGTKNFKAALGILLALSVPWLLVGNFSLKNENMIGIIAFLIYDVALLSFTIFLLCENFYQKMANVTVFLNFTGIMACVLMFASLIVAVACLLVFDRGLLVKVNRDSNASSDTVERLSIHDDEITFPNHDVAPYHHQNNERGLSGSEKYEADSNLSQPQAVLSSRLEDRRENITSLIGLYPKDAAEIQDPKKNQLSTSAPRQSWIAGDERSWMAPGTGRERRRSDDSRYSYSSGAVSYATTTSSLSGLSGLKTASSMKKPKPAML